jgi:hypothetical protein
MLIRSGRTKRRMGGEMEDPRPARTMIGVDTEGRGSTGQRPRVRVSSHDHKKEAEIIYARGVDMQGS